MFVHRFVLLGLVALLAVATTGMVVAQSTRTVTTEVRITASLQDDGRVAFGLQQREGDGWGETILPRVNKFPYARATVDRWLNSSPVSVEVEVLGGPTDPGSMTGDDPQPGESTSAWRFVHDPEFDDMLWVTDGENRRGFLALACLNNRNLQVYFRTNRHLPYNSVVVTYHVEGGALQEDHWSVRNWSSTRQANSWLAPRSRIDVDHPSRDAGAYAFVQWLRFASTQGSTFSFSAATEYGQPPFVETVRLAGIHEVLEALPCFDPV